MSNEAVNEQEAHPVSTPDEILDPEAASAAEALFVAEDDDDVIVVEEEAAAAPEADGLQAELERLRGELEVAQREAQDNRSRLLRAVADHDNFRKRINKEREDQEKYGAERLLRDFLPVIDNLERALSHAAAAEDASGLSDGVAMTLKQFRATLERFGVKAFESVGTPFDPERHEAIQQVETEEHPSNTVVQEFQKGYFMHDRLLRPALVVVARNPSDG